MKRIRAIDVPKFRRPVKSNRARLGDSVYLNPSGLVYMKLLLMWVSCILLDLLIGFRVELLWPLWLMIRHLYDAFRVQNFVSSFHYSAFSVFFVCITATSDLICYLFIPVQFVYQSTERGFCTPSFLLWGLFVGFEYVVRCRFDQSTLYLTRSSWVTAGMFSSAGTDNIFVGNQESLSRFEIYKPLAAHCLGYPIVTLGFRVKSYFSSWRLKRRKLEVMKQNEFYYRLLADAQPASYDARQLVSSKQFALENAGTLACWVYLLDLDFEIDDENVSECGGTVITNQPTICMPINGTTNTNGIFTLTSSTVAASALSTTCNRKSRNTALKSAASSTKQNGYCGTTNGAMCTGTTKRNGHTTTTSSKRDRNEETNLTDGALRHSFSVMRLPIYCFWLSQFVCRQSYESLIAPLWRFISNQLSSFLRSAKMAANSDDLLSVSGDGSILAEEESDQEEMLVVANNKSVSDITNTGKRRPKRTRGRTPAVAGEITVSAPSQQQIKPQATIAPSFATKPADLAATTHRVEINDTFSLHSSVDSSSLQQNGSIGGQLHDSTDKNDLLNGRIKEKSKSQEKCKCSIKIDELESKLRVERSNSRQQVINMEREKEILEQALDNLRSEMHQIRSNETTVRAELTIIQNQERSQRAEMNQLRTKLNDAEQRVSQVLRQMERLKKEAAIAQQQQAKRENIRGKRDDARAGTPDQQQQIVKELGEMRMRVQQLEKELQSTHSELKTKQQAYVKMEQRVRTAESSSKAAAKEMASGDSEIKSYQQQVLDLQQINTRLEKTLMSENRLKVDLFRALTDSKAQLEAMNAQMRQIETDRVRNGLEPTVGSDFNNPPLPSSLIASLANNFNSGNSSPADRVSPSSSSSHSVMNNAVTKSSASIADELEQILQNNGQYCYFGGDSFASTATPSTNAAAQALAQQLKMSASPVVTNALYNNQRPMQPRQPQQMSSSRCTSPSNNELFSILNSKTIPSSFGSYALNNPATSSSSVIGSHLNNGNSMSPAFH